jgi:hypothetical protein
MSSVKRFALDIIERAAATFVEAFAASFVASELDLWTRIQFAFAAALAAVLKGFGAKQIGAKGTAAVLPISADAASAVLDTTGKVIGTISEPIPGVKQVGDAVETGIDRATDKVQDVAVEGAQAVEGFLSRLFGGRKKP